jgi:hypothetical protein
MLTDMKKKRHNHKRASAQSGEVNSSTGGFERLIFTLPRHLAAELKQYASVLRGGNKSGFVADALRAYIDHFRRSGHTARLRQSYADSASHGRMIARDWEAIDQETWERLDKLSTKKHF